MLTGWQRTKVSIEYFSEGKEKREIAKEILQFMLKLYYKDWYLRLFGVAEW